MCLNFAPFGTDNDFDRPSGTGSFCIATQALRTWLLSCCPSGTKYAEAAKSSVETFTAGRAGAHPYRPTPLFPFRVFSRVSRAPFLLLPAFRLRIPRWLDQFFVGSAARMWTNSEGQVKYFRCTFFGHTTPDRAGARPYRVQCRVARCDMGLPAHASHPLFASFRVFRGPHSFSFPLSG